MFLCPSSEVSHCTHNNGICHTACEQDQDGTYRIRMQRPGPARKLYDIYHCCVYGEKHLMTDRGTV